MAANPRVLVVFGPQGSGKSTQVERIAKRYRLMVVEAGEILRHQAKTDRTIHTAIKQGQLIDNDKMLELIDATVTSDLTKEPTTERGFVFDGYPRNLDQLTGFSSLVDRYHWQVTGLFINLSDDSAKTRLSQRFEIVNGEKRVREDDQPSIVQKRLDTFKQETLPLQEAFRHNYRLVEIDGEPPVDGVTSLIKQALDPILNDAHT